MKICEHKLTKLSGEYTARVWFEWARTNGYEWAQSAMEQLHFNYTSTSLSGAVVDFQTWGVTKEGAVYWNTIYDKLLNENM